jgi:hypothetical protein
MTLASNRGRDRGNPVFERASRVQEFALDAHSRYLEPVDRVDQVKQWSVALAEGDDVPDIPDGQSLGMPKDPWS